MLKVRRNGSFLPVAAWFVPSAAPGSPPAAQAPDPDCRDCKGAGAVLLLNRTVRCLCMDRPAQANGGVAHQGEFVTEAKPDGSGGLIFKFVMKPDRVADPPF